MSWGAAGRFRKQVGQGDLVAIDEDKIVRWTETLFNPRFADKLEYWTDSRGVQPSVLSDLQIGWDSRRRRYTIPVRDARARCVDVKLYRPGEKEFGKSLHYTEKSDGDNMAWGKPPRLWGLDRVAQLVPGKGRAGVVLLCAGEPDAIVATDMGYLAVSPTSGEGALCRLQDAQVLLRGGWPVRLMFDTDKAGRAAAGMWAGALVALGIENLKDIELEFPNGDGKDLSEWVVSGEWGRTGNYEDAGSALWAAIRATDKLDIRNLAGSGGNAGGDSAADSTGASSDSDDEAASAGADDSGHAGGGDRRTTGSDESRRPVAELIDMALTVKLPEFGSRNRAGFWLWCQMRDERYTKNEAINLVAEWVVAVNAAAPQAGHPYSEDESRLSLDEAYSSPPREANGKGLTYQTTDLGNAERLLARHQDSMVYVPAWGGWAVWTGRVWDASAESQAQVARWAQSVPRLMYEEGAKASRLARKAAGDNAKEDPAVKAAGKLMSWARASESAGKLSAMVQLARERGNIAAEAFDRNPRALAVGNGTLFLNPDGTVAFRGHQREDYITFQAPVAYAPSAVAEDFLRFLKEILPDPDVRSYLQKLVGYSLLGGNPERKFVIIHGPTASGKSTLATILGLVLGRYASVFRLSLLREKQDEGPRPDLLGLLPARMIFASEASDSWHLHADQIKSITGAEVITVRGMHAKAYVSRKPDFTPWLVTNQIPHVKGADAALWRRLVAVPFMVTRPVGQEDTGLAERIGRTEASGVLAWALEGYSAYVADGLDDMPAEVAAHTMSVREELTELDAWLAECTEGGLEYSEFTQDLYDNYMNWCMANYIHERDRVSLRSFGKGLAGRGYSPGARRRPPESERGSAALRTWQGLRIKQHDNEGAGESSK